MPKPWTTTELRRASELWKRGLQMHEVAAEIGRHEGSLKHKVRENRDLFPRRRQARKELRETVDIKLAITPYVHKLVKEEAKARNISMNMLIREVFRDRFLRRRQSHG